MENSLLRRTLDHRADRRRCQPSLRAMQTGRLTAAATVVHHRPLLLLLLLLWSLTGPLTPALAQDHCTHAGDIVLGEGEHHTFPNKADHELERGMTLFVKRESSFAGFSVNVHASDGTEHTAWFPAEEQCFPDTDTWYQLLVFAEIMTENSAIEFGFETQHCHWTCEKYNALQDLLLQNMSVVTHGTGRWSTKDFLSTRCPFEALGTHPEHRKLPTCNKPQPGPNPGVAAGTTIAVLAVIAALVGGAVCFTKKRNGLSWGQTLKAACCRLGSLHLSEQLRNNLRVGLPESLVSAFRTRFARGEQDNKDIELGQPDKQNQPPQSATPSEGQPFLPQPGTPSEGQPCFPQSATPSEGQPCLPQPGTPSD